MVRHVADFPACCAGVGHLTSFVHAFRSEWDAVGFCGGSRAEGTGGIARTKTSAVKNEE